MKRKRSHASPDTPDDRPPIDRDLAAQTRTELPRQIVDSGLFDLDRDPAQLARVREILARLPDRAVVDVANRLRLAESAKQTDIKAFIKAHGITPAEERLLTSLVNGETVVDHAQKQGVSVNTARTHMRRLLEKTGSTGQLDLIKKTRSDS